MATKAQRRAAYKFYRDLGYSPADARNMRNAPVKTLKEYETYKREARKAIAQRKKGSPKVKKIAFPKGVVNKRMMKAIRKELVDLGISKRAAYNLTRTPENAVKARNSITGYLNTIPAKNKTSRKKQFRQMMKRWKEAQTKADIYRAIEETYMYLAGVAL